ncbi:MAG: glycoside hydrolase [Nocardioides sp.]|nr:glycoside hydrolase [Nocardioides sp.]
MTNTRPGVLARARTLLSLTAAALVGASALAVIAPAPSGAAAAESSTVQRPHHHKHHHHAHHHHKHHHHKHHHHASRGNTVVAWARREAGKPYSYGAAGPNAFDCSGLTMWVYRHVGKSLPHNSAAQAGRTQHIPRAAARRGDLVFFTDGGGVYHVAIYAGGDSVWHAPHPGAQVRKERIWTSSVFFGRVR